MNSRTRGDKIIDVEDRALICMVDLDGDIHAHTFGEVWGREMAMLRPEQVWFFAELTSPV